MSGTLTDPRSATPSLGEQSSAEGPAPLLDAAKAGELLNVPHTWLLAEARANRVPHVRLGRYVRFAPESLMDWVTERERGPRRHPRPPVG